MACLLVRGAIAVAETMGLVAISVVHSLRRWDVTVDRESVVGLIRCLLVTSNVLKTKACLYLRWIDSHGARGTLTQSTMQAAQEATVLVDHMSAVAPKPSAPTGMLAISVPSCTRSPKWGRSWARPRRPSLRTDVLPLAFRVTPSYSSPHSPVSLPHSEVLFCAFHS